MYFLDIASSINEFFDPVISFFKEIWGNIQHFLLQYMSSDVLNILVFGILIAVVLIIVLAVVNRK